MPTKTEHRDTHTIDLELAQVREARVDDIAPSPSNPRKRFDDLAELAESIRQVGVLQPLLVRPHPRPDESRRRFELVAGERRWRAANRESLEVVPVVVRNLTDCEVLELQLVENNQRSDVTPLEEADAIHELVSLHGRLPVDVADRLGRPLAYVRRRLQLNNLICPLRELLEDERIGLGSAERLARLPRQSQQELATSYLDASKTEWNSDVPMKWDARDVLSAINRVSRQLKTAPWNLSERFGDRWPCYGCSMRTGQQHDLFDPGDDRCLDQVCWNDKMSAYQKQRADEFKAQGVEVLDGDAAEAVLDSLHNWKREWLDVGERRYELDSTRPVGEYTPPDATRYAVFDPRQLQYREVVQRDDLAQALEQAGETELANKITGKAEREKNLREREKQKREAETRARRMGELVAHVAHGPDAAMLYELVFAAIHEASPDVVRAVRRRRGIGTDLKVNSEHLEGKQALKEALDQADEAWMWGLFVELLLTWPAMSYDQRKGINPWQRCLQVMARARGTAGDDVGGEAAE